MVSFKDLYNAPKTENQIRGVAMDSLIWSYFYRECDEHSSLEAMHEGGFDVAYKLFPLVVANITDKHIRDFLKLQKEEQFDNAIYPRDANAIYKELFKEIKRKIRELKVNHPFIQTRKTGGQ